MNIFAYIFECEVCIGPIYWNLRMYEPVFLQLCSYGSVFLKILSPLELFIQIKSRAVLISNKTWDLSVKSPSLESQKTGLRTYRYRRRWWELWAKAASWSDLPIPQLRIWFSSYQDPETSLVPILQTLAPDWTKSDESVVLYFFAKKGAIWTIRLHIWKSERKLTPLRNERVVQCTQESDKVDKSAENSETKIYSIE